jgi:hypothetical protein
MDQHQKDQLAEMDAAAAMAAKEFVPTWTAQELAGWLAKWYMKAGYKRLCQIVLQAFGFRA